MYHLDQDSADCFVFTFKEGLLSAIAHDLKIAVTRFQIEVDETDRTVAGRFDATSLRVVCAMQNGRESKGTLSADQKREIEGNIRTAVLQSEKFPEISYASARVKEDGDGYRIAGPLSLHGKRKTIAVAVEKKRDRYVATALLNQPDFGIRPYTALLGALKVRPAVEIRLVVPWPTKAEDAA